MENIIYDFLFFFYVTFYFNVWSVQKSKREKNEKSKNVSALFQVDVFKPPGFFKSEASLDVHFSETSWQVSFLTGLSLVVWAYLGSGVQRSNLASAAVLSLYYVFSIMEKQLQIKNFNG